MSALDHPPRTSEGRLRRYVQIYTGDGKGKTTAALGLALRAAGRGLKTYMGQFVKGISYGELDALAENPLVVVEQYGSQRCVTSACVEPEDVRMAREGLSRARNAMLSKKYDIVVLDEIFVAIRFGLLEASDAAAFLRERPEDVEVVLTGRWAPPELLEVADLVTEMKEIRHYYAKGVSARDGFER